MKKFIAVGSCTLATLSLFMMRSSKKEVSAHAPLGAPAPLQLIQRIPMPGVYGRIDHFSPHPNSDIVIFAALGNDSVEIVNAFKGKLVRSLKGLDEPQGVLYVPRFDKIFAANAGNGTVKVFDAKTYAPRKTISLGEKSDTDNLRYDEASKRVFVGIVGGIAIIDPATEAHVGNLKGSGGHSESFQLEKKGSRLFVNVPEDGNVVNVIDRKTGELTKWELNGAKGNFAMALSENDHRLFVATRRPPLLTVLDTDDGREVARVPVVGECDDVYFDAKRRRVYSIGAEGFISVLQQNDPNHYSLIANVPTAVGVRTEIFFEDDLYVGVPATGLEPVQIWNYGVPE